MCKIADFGLARDIYEKKQYLKLGEVKIGLDWIAMDCKLDRHHSPREFT